MRQLTLDGPLVGDVLVELGLPEALVVEQAPALGVAVRAARHAGIAGGDLGIAQRVDRDLDGRSGVGHLV